MDYGTLAQLSSPGQSPLAGGIVDPLGYRRWSNLAQMQQESLQRAQPLAQMNLEQEQQKNAEFMAGGPGRMDTIKLGNMNAAANLGMFDESQAIKKLESAVKNRDLAAQLADYTKSIGQWGDAYVNAKTDDEKEQVYQSVPKGIKLADGYVFGTDPAKDKTLLFGAGKARASLPGVQVKRDTEEMKQAGALARLKTKGISDIEIANIKAQHAQNLQAARLANSQNKPLTASQAEAAAVEAVYGDDDEGKIKYWFTKNQTTGATAIAAGKAATVTGATGGNIQVQGPQVAEPPAPNPTATKKPTSMNEAPKFEKGKVYQDAKGNKAKWNGTNWEPVQ